MLGSLAGSRVLSRRAAVAFVLVFYLRRLALAAIILANYKSPMTQVLLTGLLQLLYLIFLLHFKVYRDRKEYVMEVINELIILMTNYSLMTITGDFIDIKAHARMANVMIGLCLINFVVNFTPIIYSAIKGLIRRCRIKLAKEKQLER